MPTRLAPARQAVVRFLAREIDEEELLAAGWTPSSSHVHWYACYGDGRVNQPYRQPGPAGSFTRYRGDRVTALYRLDGDGGWTLDPVSRQWLPHDGPIRLFELGELSEAEVAALFELDDWGSWYFDYQIGNWVRTALPRQSHYLSDLELHEVSEAEARRAESTLGRAGNPS